jgi:hypothetical protein
MTSRRPITTGCCGRVHRRQFLADVGMGFAGLALGAMLHRDGIARAASASWAPPNGLPHFAPKARSVIWLFMVGGISQMESFDPKPALIRYAGMSIDETPHKEVLESSYLKENLRIVDKGKQIWKILYPLQCGYRKFGQSGIELSEHWPHLGQCIDDVAVIRSLWSTDDNHGAQLQFHTGRHMLDGVFPTLGAWVHYGLGSLNDNLPSFVVIGETLSSRFGGKGGHSADYLGPEHDGVPIRVDPANPLPFATPPRGVSPRQQQREFELLGDLNRLSALEYPNDPQLQARIRSYELAFGMQRSLPEVFRFEEETEATHRLYGLDDPTTEKFGRICLASRRLVERGVRFVQVYDGPGNDGGKWDTHADSRRRLAENAASVDRPVAGLLRDLKQRGLLDETLVCFMTEFGRTPGGQGAQASGREHSPYGFSVWMAGGGIKGGVVHGATDELGYHAVENRHYVTDIHATVLHQLGLDSRRLEVPGRKRLDIDHGRPIREILA